MEVGGVTAPEFGSMRAGMLSSGALGVAVALGGPDTAARTRMIARVRRAKVQATGCGDAFRAALLFGIERGWSMPQSIALGNRVGAIKIAGTPASRSRLRPTSASATT